MWWLLEKYFLIIREKNQKDSGRLETKMTEMKKYFCPTEYQIWTSLVAQTVKRQSTMWDTSQWSVSSLHRFSALA